MALVVWQAECEAATALMERNICLTPGEVLPRVQRFNAHHRLWPPITTPPADIRGFVFYS
jgi:hypothetical protein